MIRACLAVQQFTHYHIGAPPLRAGNAVKSSYIRNAHPQAQHACKDAKLGADLLGESYSVGCLEFLCLQ